jgi:hypothetical protein
MINLLQTKGFDNQHFVLPLKIVLGENIWLYLVICHNYTIQGFIYWLLARTNQTTFRF